MQSVHPTSLYYVLTEGLSLVLPYGAVACRTAYLHVCPSSFMYEMRHFRGITCDYFLGVCESLLKRLTSWLYLSLPLAYSFQASLPL